MNALDRTIKNIDNIILAKIYDSNIHLNIFKRLEVEILELKETKAELEELRRK